MCYPLPLPSTSTRRQEERPMNTRTIPIALLAFLCATSSAAQGGPPQAAPAKVNVCTVEEGTLVQNELCAGNVFYKEVSQLATEVGGKVTEVLFEEGQHLDKGAVMVRLDYALLESELRAARADVLQAETQLKLEHARL
ncbi:MAG: biotin/lipoyl-binding protein, partial [Candidatus Hydrogenedentes bacterium]|nr:biotin/lipoyl-binding protein [Candidatus Hydrogenedentota bacterium]